MTSIRVPNISTGVADLHSLSRNSLDSASTGFSLGSSHLDEEDNDIDDDSEDEATTPTQPTAPPSIPLHPITSMQEAFAESLAEVTNGSLAQKPKLRAIENVKDRRDALLDEDKAKGPPNRLWRFRPGQKSHELRKLVAQIAFGIYLLIEGMANSGAQVLSILQVHIDEIDEFLETMLEDVELAIGDLEERIDFLKLAMENMEVFEQMLENRKFRLQIVEGNVKIEHILSRTSTAHTQTIRDISEGMRATKQFATYLAEHEQGEWREQRPDVVDIVQAMKHNAEGWTNAFTSLESSSTHLSGLLVRLSSMIVEMDKKAGEASRRTRFSIQPYSHLDSQAEPKSPQTAHATTPPPSPPKVAPAPRVAPRIKTLYFESRASGFLGAQGGAALLKNLGAFAENNAIEEEHEQDVAEDKPQTIIVGQKATPHADTPPESSKTIPPELLEEDEEESVLSDFEDSESKRQTANSMGQALEPTRETQAPVEDAPKAGESAMPFSDTDDTADVTPPATDNALFILQPRTYTPVPAAPMPSPWIAAGREDDDHDDKASSKANEIISDEKELAVTTQAPPTNFDYEELKQSLGPEVMAPALPPTQPLPQVPEQAEKEVVPVDTPPALQPRSSLRQRASRQGTLPDSIRVPPVKQMRSPQPRQQVARAHLSPVPSQAGSSAQGSLAEARPVLQARKSSSNLHLSPPVAASHVPSPNSERQYFRPMPASSPAPHSPIPLRPHTAGGGGGGGSMSMPRTSNVPLPFHQATISGQGSSNLSVTNTASVRHSHLSNGSSGSTGARTVTFDPSISGGTAGSAKTLKKKKSAFGWLKKAFTLDEEEKMQYEQRKMEQSTNMYHDGRSPVFLDGKRIR